MTSNHSAEMLIAGEWRMRDAQPVFNPWDEKRVGQRAHAQVSDLEDAVHSGLEGGRVWAAMSPFDRGAIMGRAANLLRERADSIGNILSLEQGKPLVQAKWEVEQSAKVIEWDAAEGRRIYGRIVPSAPGMHMAVYHQPIGIVAGFAPWNFPLVSPTKKLSGPLAAGCAVILKPSEETPGTGHELVRAFHDAGVPRGVVNLVYGTPSEISQYLIPHPAVRAVTFTGSVPVGRQLTALAGANLKPVLMELGGHSPVFISATANIDKVAEMAALSKASNAGQICVSPTRFFVEEAVYSQFSKKMAERAGSIRYGSGLDANTQMGPVINEKRLEAIESFVADAREKGARVLSGGSRWGERGYGYELTVLGDVSPTSRAMKEEPFGPLALLTPVASVEDAIERANEVEYGLAGYAFTTSVRDVQLLTERLQVGNLGINQFSASSIEMPMGGMKDSGIGRSGGIEGLRNFTNIKTVVTQAY